MGGKTGEPGYSNAEPEEPMKAQAAPERWAWSSDKGLQRQWSLHRGGDYLEKFREQMERSASGSGNKQERSELAKT